MTVHSRAFAVIGVMSLALAPPLVAQDSSAVRTDTQHLRLVEGRDAVYMETVVDLRPQVLASPPIRYPDKLRQAGLEGRVVVEAIIDTLGRAEPRSVKIIGTPDLEFADAARDWVRHANFRPGRVRGRPVRVLVRLPVDFKLNR